MHLRRHNDVAMRLCKNLHKDLVARFAQLAQEITATSILIAAIHACANIVLNKREKLNSSSNCTFTNWLPINDCSKCIKILSNHTCEMGTPKVFRSSAYFDASSSARQASPTAPAATPGLVVSNAPIATLNPAPGAPKTF